MTATDDDRKNGVDMKNTTKQELMFSTFSRIAMIMFCTAALVVRVQAQNQSVPVETTEATGASALTKVERMREMLTASLIYLREQATGNELGFVVPPVSQRRVQEYKEVEVRYSKKIIEEPIYEYETYKTVEAVRTGDSAAGPTQLKTVTKRRIKRQKGTRKVERTVRDPNGDIVRTEKRPVYEPGGPDFLQHGFFGQNALAIYVNLVCGVPPNDPALAKTCGIVADFADAYGAPDNTWDLAWLTAAMVNLPADDNPMYAKLSRQLVNKLLLGQIMNGKGAGLWGPVSINPEILAKMTAYEQDVYEDEVKPWQQKLKEKPDRERYQENLAKAERAAERFHHQFRQFTQLGLKFQYIRNDRIGVKAKEGTEGKLGLEVGAAHIRGLPIYIYGEQIGDIEHTAVALFALKQAAKNGYLPEQTAMPLDIKGNPLIRPLPTMDILARSVEALNSVIRPNGTATQANTWQAIHAFDDVGVLGLPYADDRIDELDSQMTLLSTAQAYTSLLNAVDIAADSRLTALAAPKLRAARGTVEQMAKSILAGDTRGVEIGGHLDPFDFILQLSLARKGNTGFELSNRELWLEYADFLLHNRQEKQEEPVWNPEKASGRASSTAIRQYFEKDVRVRYAERGNELNDKNARQWVGTMLGRTSRRQTPKIVATAYAMIFLAEDLRPPVAAAWAWDDKPPRTATIKAVIDRLSTENEVKLTYSVLDAELSEKVMRNIPVLLISGVGEFEPAYEKSLEILAVYLNNGGLIAVEAPANPAGMAFLATAKTAIMKMIDNAEFTQLSLTDEKIAEIFAVNDGDGNAKALFLPIATGGNDHASAIKSWQALQAVYQVLLKSVNPDFLSRQYAIDWNEITDKEARMAAEKEAEMNKEFGLQ